MKKNYVSIQPDNFCKTACLLLLIILASATNGFAARTSTLSGGGTAAAFICAPATDALIFSFADGEGSTNTTTTGINFTTTGTALWGNDVTDFTVWSNTSNTLTGATSLGTLTGTSGAASSGAHTISWATLTMTKSVTTYYFITATLAATATNARTIAVSAMSPHAANVPFIFSGTSPASYPGSASAGGTQTITIMAPLSGASSLCGAVGTTTNYTDATGGGAWSSSVPGVATVSGGTVTGVSSGVTTISYTVGSCLATQDLTYATGTPSAISGPASICPPVLTTLAATSFESGITGGGWGTGGGATGMLFQQLGSGTYEPYSGGAEDGSYVAEFDFYDYSSGNVLLYSPAFSMVNTTGGLISFWVYRDDGYYPYSYGYTTEGLTVAFNTTHVAAGATILGFIPRSYTGPTTGSLSGVSTPSSPGWYQYTVSIPATYTGTTNYLLFRGSTEFGENMYLDNVVVTGNIASTITLSDATAGGAWSSGNTSVVTVDPSSGVATGVSVGTASVTYSNVCGSVNETVSVLGLVTGTASVCPLLTTTLSDAITGGAWTTSTSSLATVSGTGVVTGLSAGLALITYSIDDGCLLTTSVTVNPAPAAITGSSVLCSTVSLHFSDASSGGTWSSSNSSIASVGSLSGLVTPATPGSATITYTLPTTCIATETVTTNPIPLPVIANPNICQGLTYPLSDATAGGTWSSSVPTAASIVTLTSIQGIATSPPVPIIITYTLPTSCIATMTATVQPLPSGILANVPVCVNVQAILSDSTTGGVWTSNDITKATVGYGTGVLTGVAAGNPSITYTLPTGCITLTTATVNALPSPISSTLGTFDVCVGSSDPLADGGAGTWSSSNPGLASVDMSSGIVMGLLPGLPVITYTLPPTAGSCMITTTVTVNPVPAPITGSPQVCYGLTTTLNDATGGGTWSSTIPGNASVDPSGVVTGTSASGAATDINYTLSTGCEATMSFTDNALPTQYTVSGTGNYCPGTTPPDISITPSDIGVNYQLYYNGSPIAYEVLGGTGSTLDFGTGHTAAGNYTVVATNAATGCTQNMNGTAVIGILPAPQVRVLGVSNGGNYCVGSAGVDMYIDSSEDISIAYQLYGPGGSIYFAYAFTGDTADFFVQPYAPGVYTATATEGTCVTNMSGSVTVTENALPVSTYNVTVTDGGNYCSGTPGVHVDLDNSGTGINYYLYNSNFGYAVDSLPGSNSSLDFGYQKTGVGTGSPATFSVTGINMTTGCSSNMTGSPMVTENPLPDPIYFVAATGSSSFCAGGSGVDITLSGSDNYINYQLLVNGVADTLIPGNGSGSALDYGNQTDTGIYTVTGINQTTGCTNMMPGSAHLHTYNALNVYNLSSSASSYCVGGSGVLFTMSNSDPSPVSYILYNGATPVDTVAGTGSTLSLGINTAGNYRAVAYNTSSGCTTNMTGNPVIDTNALPAQYPVTGGGDFCAGGSVNVGLVFSDVGVSYQLYRGGIAIGGSTGGSSSALDFGTFTTSGTYSVFASNVITGCGDSMANDVTVSGKGLPTAYTVTGGGSFCVGGTGVPVGLSNSDGGIRYELYNGYSAGVSLNGGGGALGYGLQTATGHYTVVATDTTTGCTQNMTGGAVVTTNPLPAVNNVTGGGGFCAGSTGVHLGLDGSTTGIQYHLMNGLIPAGMVNGTGGALDFGITTVAGNYTVTANNVTSGCTSNMNGSGVVTVNPLPAQYTVTGGGAYCAGGGGADIGLNSSDPGVNYQVYVGGAPSGGYVSGTGIILDLGYQAGAGTYTVTGANAATGCASSMLGSTNVSVNPLPAIYTVTGSGHFCAGGTGIAVLLSGSHTGISYQLYNGTSLAGRAVTGTGTGVSFGSQTTDGTYTAVATNTATGCSSNMNGSGTVSVDPLPDAFTITGGGNYCAGGTGVAVGLSGSVSGINYRLYNGTTPEGLAVGGTGTLITFGLQRDGGSVYTVGATNTTTGCMNNMTGTTSVVVNPVVTPAVSITTSTGDDTACIGAATLYTAVPSYGGLSPLYQWTVNGLPTASGSAYTYIASGGDVVGVTMSGDAACATTSTASKSLTMNVIPYQTPSANITINPGNNVCHGTTVSLAATSDYGGAAPGYAWLRNSIPVGAGMSYSYTPGTADNGDVLIFRLNSNYRCRTINTDTVFSNAIVMVVDSAETPAFKISSHLGPVIGVGRVDTFTATLTGATKGQISYQWMINNTPVPGATSALYIDFDVFNNDKVSCDVTRSGACGNETASQSFTVVTLVNVGVQQITGAGTDISVLPNPNKGAFTVKGTLGVTGDEDVTLEVTDMLGQVVYKSNVTARGGVLDEHIQLSNAANGMYLLSLHSAVANNVYHIVVDQ